MKKEELLEKYNELEKDYLELQNEMELMKVQHDTYDLQMNSYKNEMKILQEANQELTRNAATVHFDKTMSASDFMLAGMTDRMEVSNEPDPATTITLNDILGSPVDGVSTSNYGPEGPTLEDLF